MVPLALLINVLVVLLIVGVILWAVSQIPMDPAIAKVIRIVVVVFVMIWLIYFLAGLMVPGFEYPFRR
jgi:hypothetical protein